MLKKLQRDKDKAFKHIAPGLIPAASIAPKPAVPRTPPPRSPDPSPERPRSALAAAILSSSLTGQTWAIPLAGPRSFSESDHSESFISEPHISTAVFTRDRWSETNLPVRRHLFSSDHSDRELEDKEEDEEEEEEEDEEDEEDREDHIYQTLDRGDTCSLTEPVYAVPLKPKTRTSQPAQMSGRRLPAPDFTEETSVQSPEASCDSSKKKIRKSSCRQKEDEQAVPPILTTDLPSQAKSPKQPTQPSPEPSKAHVGVQSEAARALPKEARVADEQKLMEKRLLRLEQQISHSQASSTLRSSAGSQAELQNLRQHAQELVDENDALKLTVHRLNVELSRYQTRFRPLSKQESSKISGLPKTGSPPPWLLDIKYLSPLLLAYEDRMNEKDALLQTTEEEVKRLRVHVEEVIKENERLHDEIAKIGGVSQKDCHQLQQQAFMVLQENQVLIDQLEAQHVKAKANHSRHHSEVSKVSKQLMMLEAENQRSQEELEESRREAQKNTRQVQVLQARLKDAVTWDEHCSIAGKLRGQLEQQENSNKSTMDELLLRVSSLQEESRSLALDKANLGADIKRMEAELELCRQDNRKAGRRMCVLKLQKEECVLKAEQTRHYLGAVMSLAENISQERDQLQHMASDLQQEKQHFISRILNGTVRFGKLREEVKVYRRQASTRLAALEEAAEGRTASHRREILHLQRLLRERQEAEERLLQSKREVEEELEVVWEAAIRENQQMKETLLDSRLTEDIHGLLVSTRASPVWPPPAAVENTSPTRHQPHSFGSPLFSSDRSPALQRRSVFKSDSDHPNDSIDEKHKHGLDFYC
ncbi:centrosomal protein of 89 kDa isoform X1 [Hippoglossus hippoglossus]|uniref:centrosomal protein of 89 kDa isoform X1 n=1 Tax=Hippoglossus hippoglossus TaxID=8267 RepID=UPI00148E08D6|nr:centrosomal protein of 89 kDa isoform X1 [Hippoglossus hippoglossus]